MLLGRPRNRWQVGSRWNRASWGNVGRGGWDCLSFQSDKVFRGGYFASWGHWSFLCRRWFCFFMEPSPWFCELLSMFESICCWVPSSCWFIWFPLFRWRRRGWLLNGWRWVFHRTIKFWLGLWLNVKLHQGVFVLVSLAPKERGEGTLQQGRGSGWFGWGAGLPGRYW